MELRQIRYFIKVAELEHVSEAAAELHVAQSAVSRQIANLEAELGVKLFLRGGRKIRLTPVGEIFLDRVKRAMLEFDKAEREIYEYLNPESGTIRLGFPTSLAAKTLPNVISAFRKEHPQIGFQLHQGTVKELTDAVISGHIDIAFVSPVPSNQDDIEGHIFFTEKIMALLSKHHELANEPYLRLIQLRHEPFVIFRQGYIIRDIIMKASSQVGFQPRIAFEGEDVDTIKGLVSAGLGVSLLPEITLNDMPMRDTKSIEIIEPNVSRTVGIILPSNREVAPSEQVFFEFLESYYEKLNRFVY
ncbi:LysR family transcriptional regulator [Tenuibacillus multivorans]|uniref:LysR family transcriptional regulator, transcription activator of glutamate synthase operon n=1 Tax=Tenuibacillus multivorans TaxID=237069 RepID=A0A1H0C3T6_9BACI|nr:LysR family transcriptional regulator [Tenuibacillus multivorans]GEL77755.1 HTH-type transcriptional regulator GltC [Tenuibacillus multivorans]SDN52503.1 LysR family transcriptional regulator, transcription activator of glutamate synthase operon [Tenuibacillus multivorans]